MSSIRKVCVAAVLATVANQSTNAVQLKVPTKWMKSWFPSDKSSSSGNFMGFVTQKDAKKEQKAIKKSQEAIEKKRAKTQEAIEKAIKNKNAFENIQNNNAFKKIDEKREKAEKKMKAKIAKAEKEMEDAAKKEKAKAQKDRNKLLERERAEYWKNLVKVKRNDVQIQNAEKEVKKRERINNAQFAKISAKNAADVVYGSQLVNEAMQVANAALKTSANAALKTSAFEAFKNALAETGLPDVEEGTLKKEFESIFHSTEQYEKIVSMVAAEKARADAAAAAADQARTQVESLQKELSIAQEQIAAAGEAKRITDNEIAALRTELSAAKIQNAALLKGDVDPVLYNLIRQTKKLEEPSAHPKDLKQAQLHIASALNNADENDSAPVEM